LKKATEDKLVKLVPGLTDDLLKEMRKPPVRSDVRASFRSRTCTE